MLQHIKRKHGLWFCRKDNDARLYIISALKNAGAKIILVDHIRLAIAIGLVVNDRGANHQTFTENRPLSD